MTYELFVSIGKFKDKNSVDEYIVNNNISRFKIVEFFSNKEKKIEKK